VCCACTLAQFYLFVHIVCPVTYRYCHFVRLTTIKIKQQQLNNQIHYINLLYICKQQILVTGNRNNIEIFLCSWRALYTNVKRQDTQTNARTGQTTPKNWQLQFIQVFRTSYNAILTNLTFHYRPITDLSYYVNLQMVLIQTSHNESTYIYGLWQLRNRCWRAL